MLEYFVLLFVASPCLLSVVPHSLHGVVASPQLLLYLLAESTPFTIRVGTAERICCQQIWGNSRTRWLLYCLYGSVPRTSIITVPHGMIGAPQPRHSLVFKQARGGPERMASGEYGPGCFDSSTGADLSVTGGVTIQYHTVVVL